jgi:short-subunit dehydrogenase
MDPGQAGGISVEKAARTIVKAVRKGRREVLVGGKELVMVPIKRFFPGLCARLARKLKPV